MLENLAVFPTANANDLHLILVDSDNGSISRWRDDDVILMDILITDYTSLLFPAKFLFPTTFSTSEGIYATYFRSTY
jgi:hypothetical protein